MPEVRITIGGREFEVACQEGEEHFLTAAARMLDTEAEGLVQQIGRMPETRMLLMSGLMLADRTAAMEDQLRAAEARCEAVEAKLAEMKAAATGPGGADGVAALALLKEIAERAETLAQKAGV